MLNTDPKSALKRSFVLDPPAARPTGLGTGKLVDIDTCAADLKAKISGVVEDVVTNERGDSWIIVQASRIYDVIAFLRDDPKYRCQVLQVISAVDYLQVGEVAEGAQPISPRIEVVYVVMSMEHKHQFMIKVKLPRDNPKLPSICGLFRVANFQERECFDLLGVVFEGHPDLRRVLLPDDWIGYPLRKDYVFPEEYNGMKVPL